MDKPILAVDFEGAFLRRRPFQRAHKDWFRVMSILLNDPLILEYAKLENYFPKVREVMKRYLGDINAGQGVFFARTLYAMATVAEVSEDDVIRDFADWLDRKKPKYGLASITTTPQHAVVPILRKVNCADLFHIIYSSPEEKEPSKEQLFKEFIDRHGNPKFYIGRGDNDLLVCKRLGVPTISVSWVSAGPYKGDYNANTVAELEKIVSNA